MNKVEANKQFPLWKVQFEQFVYGKDSGTPYDDPENDIRRAGNIVYYSKDSIDGEWVKEYEQGFNDFDYAMHEAAITLAKLQERHGIWPSSEDVVMFQWNGHMFKDPYWIPAQKCMCGESIDHSYYNDYEGDYSVKINILHDHVSCYDRDCLVIENGKLWLNGEVVMTKDEFESESGFRYDQAQNMYPSRVADWLKSRFPQATSYASWQAGGTL